jgi:hypothetical protein
MDFNVIKKESEKLINNLNANTTIWLFIQHVVHDDIQETSFLLP